MKITISGDSDVRRVTLYMSDDPGPADIAALLIHVLPTGQDKNLLRTQRRMRVIEALDALDREGV